MKITLLTDQPKRLACYVSAGSQQNVILEISCEHSRLIIRLPFIRRPTNWAYGIVTEDYRLWVFKGMASVFYWK
jgi:hypothetical protein